MIRLKRVYDPPGEEDGFRVLVERLWPRGLSRERARVDLWLKEIAPSSSLRSWYGHDVARWEEFQRRYQAELEHDPAIQQMQELLREKQVLTFVYAARDVEHNSALVLKAFLEEHSGNQQ